jgi:glutaminase
MVWMGTGGGDGELRALFEIYSEEGFMPAPTAALVLSQYLTTHVTVSSLGCESTEELLEQERFAAVASELLRERGLTDERMTSLFERVSGEDSSPFVSAGQLQSLLDDRGIQLPDVRLPGMTRERFADPSTEYLPSEFVEIVRGGLGFFERVTRDELAIPQFSSFSRTLDALHSEVHPLHEGKNADYIPVLRDAPWDRWGVAVCSVDGQRHRIGHTRDRVSVQSTTKAILYAMALEGLGSAAVRKRVGVEPSGRAFDSPSLLPDGRPFNPMVNAGALMTSSLVAALEPEKTADAVIQRVADKWSRLAGGARVELSRETMEAEKGCANTNFSLAYLLNAQAGLPSDLHKTCDVYFGSCSLELSCDDLAVAAATLANGGLCPTTGERVLTTGDVKDVLSVMTHCGMYDGAGQFFFEMGMPAKSGVSGLMMVVVPNLCGFATFSPRLDVSGNSVRGVAFFERLVEHFSIHVFDNRSSGVNGFKTELGRQETRRTNTTATLRWAADHGDATARLFQGFFLKLVAGLSISLDQPIEVSCRNIQRAYYECVGGLLELTEVEELLSRTPPDALARLLAETKKNRLVFPREVTSIFAEGIRRQTGNAELLRSDVQSTLLPLFEAVGISEKVGVALLTEWKSIKANNRTRQTAEEPSRQAVLHTLETERPPPVLTPAEAAAVFRRVWKIARIEPEKFARQIYSRLFWEDATVATLFKGTVMVTQGARLVAMIDHAVRLLDNLDELADALNDLGRRHRTYGVLPEHYESVGAAFHWAMKQSVGPQMWSREADAAWSWFFDFVNTNMNARDGD